MYNKILVPLDPAHLEDVSDTLALANHLKSKDGKILLLTVVEEIPTYIAAQIPADLIVNSEKLAKDDLGKVASTSDDIDAMVKTGHAAATIKQVQQDENCDLIIISSHKPTTVDYVLGSTASKVVRRAQCPVFVTR